VNHEDAVLYVPALDDNRYLPEDEQVWVEMLPMTGEELRAYQRTMARVKPGSSEALASASKVVERIISERVLSVNNYSDIKGTPITTGAQLFERGETAMVDDIFEGLTSISALKKGLKKK